LYFLLLIIRFKMLRSTWVLYITNGFMQGRKTSVE
jgi:hypothetical protein